MTSGYPPLISFERGLLGIKERACLKSRISKKGLFAEHSPAMAAFITDGGPPKENSFNLTFTTDANTHFAKTSDFTHHLPTPLLLKKGRWRINLVTFMDTTRVSARTKSTPSHLYVFCDLCETSHFNGKWLPLLRRVPIHKSGAMDYRYIYFDDSGADWSQPLIWRDEIKSIRLWMHKGPVPSEEASFLKGPLLCTLRFERLGE